MSSELDDNASWLDICDEELMQEEKNKSRIENNSSPLNKNNASTRDDKNAGVSSNQVLRAPSTTQNDSQTSNENVLSLMIDEEDELWRTPTKSNPSSEDKHLKTPPSTNSMTISYAKVLSSGLKTASQSISTSKTVQTAVSTDDLSLTSHLDVFHVNSPHKEAVASQKTQQQEMFVDEDTVMFSPCKKTNEVNVTSKNSKRPFTLIDSPAGESRESNISGNNARKVAKSGSNTDVHSSSVEENNCNSPSSKRELEVNPEVLCRRQKQIDYGKNTLGYERYTKIVPKHKRTKEHPKTPPKHLKMSRRAWDGLIKNWRLKLHKWDPDSGDVDLNNSDVDRYSLSSDDPTGYDSSSVKSFSTVSTSNQSPSRDGDDDRDSWTEKRKKSDNSKEMSDDDEYLGCEPLSENIVEAYL